MDLSYPRGVDLYNVVKTDPIDELRNLETVWRVFTLMAILFGIARSLCVRFLWNEVITEGMLEEVAPEDSAAAQPIHIAVEKLEAALRSMGAPDYPHEEGALVPPDGQLLHNCATEQFSFDNDLCWGAFLSMHRATHDKALDRCGTYPHGEYFLNKSRLWEVRFQFNFKVPPKAEDLFFGIELAQYVHVAGAAKKTQALLVRMLKEVVGHQVYHSVGDNPETSHGPIERPCFMMPLWAFDQFIVTPEGETPPKLNDPDIPNKGKKRSGRVKEYQQEVDSLDFQVGPTYTLCFWGISKFLDKINWKFRLPFAPLPIGMNMFCGSPPVHLVMYTLKPEVDGETRRLQDRKNYYFDIACWSSKDRPPIETLDVLLRLSNPPDSMPIAKRQISMRDANGGKLGANGEKLQSQGVVSWITCCAPFIARPALRNSPFEDR